MKSIHPRVLTFTLAGLLGAASASALAQPMPEAAPATGAPSFQGIDSNGDGKISLAEFKAQGGDDQVFAEIDTNQDKSLSQDEFAKLGKPGA
jgi:opacity protein-like surface antigen